MPKIPVVALVGPPNVGKSTLFNTILGKRVAITGPKPGTTRDRSYGETRWQDKKFILVDTGGLAKRGDDPLEKNIADQTRIALAEADIILFIADAKAPISAAADAVKELKSVLRKNKSDLPHILVVGNKADKPSGTEIIEDQFRRLGLGKVYTTSALTGRGVGDLLDEVVKLINESTPEEEKVPPFATLAIVGKPNVGKSTLIRS